METLGLCVRRAGSDLNPNHLSVFICLVRNEQLRGHVADLPTSPGRLPICFQWIVSQMVCKREIRGTGARAQIEVSCACRGVIVLICEPRRHPHPCNRLWPIWIASRRTLWRHEENYEERCRSPHSRSDSGVLYSAQASVTRFWVSHGRCNTRCQHQPCPHLTSGRNG